MKRIPKLFLLVAGFALIGQGCLGGGRAGGPDGGLWQTTDSGKNWAHLAALPQAGGVGSTGGVNVNAIEIDPSDDTAYYMATVNNGLFYSYDNGSTWQRPEDAAVRAGNVLDVEVDPRDVCTIYVLKKDAVLKSTDCGRTYQNSFVESRENNDLTAFVIDWYSPDILWAGTSDGEILRTKDAGATWSSIQQFRDDVTALALSNADSRILLVGTEKRGLQVRDPNTGAFTDYEDILNKDFKESDRVYGFAQTANGSKIVMSTKYGLLVSTDKGNTWEALKLVTPPGEVEIRSVEINPKNLNTIYYGTDTAFYATTNGGESWETLELPSTRALTVLEVHPSVTNVVLAGFATIE